MNDTWQTADKKSISGIKEMLNTYTLDPTVLNYGKFVSKTKKEQFHPKSNIKEDRINFNFRFYEACWNYQGEKLQSDYLEVKKLVSAHFKTDRFKTAVKNAFNCVSIELTGFWTKESLSKLKYNFSRDWYTHIGSNVLFPLDGWYCKEFKTEYKKLQTTGDRLKKEGKIHSYYINIIFKEVHFTPSEFKEMVRCSESEGHTALPVIQARRMTEKLPERFSEFKKITFKSTGRSIHYNTNRYSTTYVEIEPFITKPIS